MIPATHTREAAVKRLVLLGLILLLVTAVAWATQTKSGVAGHWEGTISVPGSELQVVIDLDLDSKGAWTGSMDIPQQGAKGVPLKDISVSDEAVTIKLPSAPGDPAFKLALSSDGAILKGELTQGGNNFPVSLKKTGPARVTAEAKNALLPEKFVGTWEGTLQTPGGSLRLRFNLSNKDGAASGTIDSLDQGATGIPVNEITVSDNSIKLAVRAVGGQYTGKLSDDSQTIAGSWTQGGVTLEVSLTRKPQ